MKETTLSQSYAFKGRIINVREDVACLPNGRKAGREVVEHSGGVCVIALTDDNEILLVRQYRYAAKEELFEIPAGKLEYGEDPLECGKRELLEETGYIAGKVTSLGIAYPTPAYCEEIIHMFLAQDLTFVGQKLDEDEFLEVVPVSLDKAVEMVMNGEIKDAKTQIAVLKLDKIKKRDYR